MGKGDKKTRRGKIILGTFGARRRPKKAAHSALKSTSPESAGELKEKKPVRARTEPKEARPVAEAKEKPTKEKAAPKATKPAKEKKETAEPVTEAKPKKEKKG